MLGIYIVQDRKGGRLRVDSCIHVEDTLEEGSNIRDPVSTQWITEADWGCRGIRQQLRCLTMLKWCSHHTESNRKTDDTTVQKTVKDYLVLFTRPQSLCTHSLFNIDAEPRPQTYPHHHHYHLTSTANISAQTPEASVATAKIFRCQLAFSSPPLFPSTDVVLKAQPCFLTTSAKLNELLFMSWHHLLQLPTAQQGYSEWMCE